MMGVTVASTGPFAPRSRTPELHHSFFTSRMLFLTPNEQCQSTEGNAMYAKMMTQLILLPITLPIMTDFKAVLP